GVELEGLTQAAIDGLGKAQARHAARRSFGDPGVARQHVQNGPGLASVCPPWKIGVAPLVKRSITGAYSPDQLPDMMLRKSGNAARLAAAMAAWTSASTSRSSLSRSPAFMSPAMTLRIVTTGSRAFQRSTSPAVR